MPMLHGFRRLFNERSMVLCAARALINLALHSLQLPGFRNSVKNRWA